VLQDVASFDETNEALLLLQLLALANREVAVGTVKSAAAAVARLRKFRAQV